MDRAISIRVFWTIGVLIASLAHGHVVFADSGVSGIAVAKTAGVISDGRAATAVDFTTTTGEKVAVNLVDEQAHGEATGSNGASATSSAISYKTLCETPCALNLDPGYYKLMFGDTILAAQLSLNVNGGHKAYEVEPASPGIFFGGVALGALGLVAALGGFISFARNSGPGMAALGLGGIGLTIGGFVLSMGGRGTTRELQ